MGAAWSRLRLPPGVDMTLVRTMRDALQWQALSVEASDGFWKLHIVRSKTDQEACGCIAYLTELQVARR